MAAWVYSSEWQWAVGMTTETLLEVNTRRSRRGATQLNAPPDPVPCGGVPDESATLCRQNSVDDVSWVSHFRDLVQTSACNDLPVYYSGRHAAEAEKGDSAGSSGWQEICELCASVLYHTISKHASLFLFLSLSLWNCGLAYIVLPR